MIIIGIKFALMRTNRIYPGLPLAFPPQSSSVIMKIAAMHTKSRPIIAISCEHVVKLQTSPWGYKCHWNHCWHGSWIYCKLCGSECLYLWWISNNKTASVIIRKTYPITIQISIIIHIVIVIYYLKLQLNIIIISIVIVIYYSKLLHYSINFNGWRAVGKTVGGRLGKSRREWRETSLCG